MITVSGTKEELTTVLKDLAPNYPADLIEHLTPDTWSFMRAGVHILLKIEREGRIFHIDDIQFDKDVEKD